MLVPLTAEQQQWVDSTLQSMTLSQCVGQLLCASHPRFTTDEWLALLDRVPLGALTVRHVSSPELREQMQRLQERSPIPLLVAGDLEHGANALTDGTQFPWMMAAGAADDEALMRQMGQATAAEARHAGIHWTFAPVVDLNYNFNNPITNVRALSDQPDRVIRLATALIQGMQADGLLAATAKHFPGDGMDDRDQHLATTVNHLPFAQWQETYGRVWRAVIDAGVMCVMPGHISLPDYQGFTDQPEAAPPATLSAHLLQDLLRKELGFDGVIISDASGMIGLTTRVPGDERAVRCIQAGCDVYLFPETLQDYERLLQAVQEGRLAEERVWDAARRVLELKARLNLHRDPFGPKPSDADTARHHQAAQEMADKSITVLRGDGCPPADLQPGSRVLTVTIGAVSPFSRFMPQPELPIFDEELRRRGFHVTHLLNPGDDELLAAAAAADVAFVNLLALPYMVLGIIRNLVGHLGYWRWRSLFMDHPRVYYTTFGNPYVLHEMPHLPNLLAAYGDAPVSQRAAVKVWLGELEARGTCPVRLPQVRVRPLAD
ncbi:glycoside hydrolase family 3 protein [Litorilinea aerophila]|uniref:beta-N-acetylhexosaminidase n=1 Tax=Litorilinea aerophila TaxID=1204385 RepID=A0A540VEL5_9CHLR|nr:glycoside hydrolase family 3 N-terminal domain-containing protein [Litorilinea aerophila]MCC9077154.1 glycoside hydrolase family 3 protein [Litorilinea aerophila]